MVGNIKAWKSLVCKIMLVVLMLVQMAGASGVIEVNAAKKLDKLILSGGYFDTGVYINQDYSIEMTFAVYDVTQYKNYYVCTSSDNQRVIRLRNEVGKGLYASYGWYNGNVYTMKANDEMTVAQKKNITYINGNQVQKATVQKLQAATTLKFGDFKGYIKSFKMWNESNVLIADYEPALDSNGKACLYNNITGQYLYYTGQCLAGEETNPSEEENVGSTPDNESGEIIETETSVEGSSELESSENTSENVKTSVKELVLNGGSFDSGLIVKLGYSLEATFTLSTTSQYGNIYISTASNNNRVLRLRQEGTKGLYAAYGWYNGQIYSPKADEKITFLQKENISYINGVQVQKATVQTLESATTLKFGDFKGSIESFRIWDDKGNLILNCLPTVDSSDKPCMYDEINNRYIYYSGTCKAVLSEENVEEESTEVIESSEIVESSEIIESTDKDDIYQDDENSSNINDLTTDEASVYGILKDALLANDSSVKNISAYNIKYNRFCELWTALTEECYLEYHTYGQVFPTPTIKDSTSMLMKSFYLSNTDNDYFARLERVKKSINYFLSTVGGDMSDVEKVLLAHEYIVNNCTYKTSGAAVTSAGGVLGDGYGICCGYTDAMVVLLHYMGIKTDTVTSANMNHEWLYVNLDGEWYHIDATWDDTRQGSNGEYSHKYFIRNDNEFETNSAKHYNWTVVNGSPTSTSAIYTNWFVHNVASTMYYYKGLWYYKDISTNTIKASDITGTNTKIIVDGNVLQGTVEIVKVNNGELTYYCDGVEYRKNI